MSERKGLHGPKEPPKHLASLYSGVNLAGGRHGDFPGLRIERTERAQFLAQPEMEKTSHPVAHEEQRQATRDNAEPEQPQGSKPRETTASPIAPQIAVREDIAPSMARRQWSAPGGAEIAPRPAWLTARSQPAGVPPAALNPQETLQGSRDRLTSRWFALKGVFESVPPVVEAPSAPPNWRAPVLAMFSLAGGAGKTSLAATLARALSSRGERVLLVDMAPFGLLPFFFGASDRRPGQLRTFSPPVTSGDAPVQMIAIDPEGLGAGEVGQDALSTEIQKHSRGVGRVVIDLATASTSTMRRTISLLPLVLVPVVPDLNSVLSVSSIDAFFEQCGSAAGTAVLPHYVLNQFDASLPLHLDVREVLREQLGDRLLPFALRRAPAVSESLAEGMTVMDYAPNSTIAEEFGNLAVWVKSQSAPAVLGFRGVRWSERA